MSLHNLATLLYYSLAAMKHFTNLLLQESTITTKLGGKISHMKYRNHRCIICMPNILMDAVKRLVFCVNVALICYNTALSLQIPDSRSQSS
jgi:hypothetical protein